MPLVKRYPGRLRITPKLLSVHGVDLVNVDKKPEYQYQLKTDADKIIDPIALACWMYEHGKKDTRIFCKIGPHSGVDRRVVRPATPPAPDSVSSIFQNGALVLSQSIMK